MMRKAMLLLGMMSILSYGAMVLAMEPTGDPKPGCPEQCGCEDTKHGAILSSWSCSCQNGTVITFTCTYKYI